MYSYVHSITVWLTDTDERFENVAAFVLSHVSEICEFLYEKINVFNRIINLPYKNND